MAKVGQGETNSIQTEATADGSIPLWSALPLSSTPQP